MDFRIKPDDLSDVAIRSLLRVHLEFSSAQSPAESCHALDIDALKRPEVSFYAARETDDTLLGCGALRTIDSAHAEIKSMHTVAGARGRGVGAAMLGHLIDEARRRGCTRLSLETGSMESYAPARRLYARHGFVECGPFEGYRQDPHSTFMTLDLSTSALRPPHPR